MDDGNASDADAGDASGANAGEASDSPSEADRRLWLVERTYTDKGMVSLIYATTDGEYSHQRQRSMNMLRQGADVTAAIDADAESLEAVEDPETRERYAGEATRMADRHDPDESV